jgi:hypothetical protein
MNSTTENHPGGGPRTEAGKTRSSRNALSHGILSQRIFLLQNEDPKEWQKLQDICVRKFKPADDYEARIVQNIAYAEWRLQRLYAMENATIDIEIIRQDAEFEKQYNGTADEFMRNALAFEAANQRSTSLSLMLRYQARITRDIRQFTQSLFDLREQERKHQCPEPELRDQPEPNPAPEPPASGHTAAHTRNEGPVAPTPTNAHTDQPSQPPTAPVVTYNAPDPLNSAETELPDNSFPHPASHWLTESGLPDKSVPPPAST